MKLNPSTIRSCAQHLRRSEYGLALIEFALSLPVFVVLILGGLEVSNLVLTHMRLNQIAMTVADNAGRVRTSIDESHIYEVFAGADLVGDSIDFKKSGRIVLSSLQPNGLTGGNAGQMINWQRCHGDLSIGSRYGVQNTGRTDASLANGMGPPDNRIVAADGTAVMFVEVVYNYRPTIFFGFSTGVHEIRYESAFNVRERTNQNITNTQGLAINNCT